nr:DNA-directed RNA polymerases II, IV and V subunit 9B isoform X2 [Ipomoea trifida]
MSTVKFCCECNNILYPKEDKARKILLYACRNCDHQEEADNNYVYRNVIEHSVDELTQVLQDVTEDPTLPRTKAVRCAECGHGEAVFFQVLIFVTPFYDFSAQNCLNLQAMCFYLVLIRTSKLLWNLNLSYSTISGFHSIVVLPVGAIFVSKICFCIKGAIIFCEFCLFMMIS